MRSCARRPSAKTRKKGEFFSFFFFCTIQEYLSVASPVPVPVPRPSLLLLLPPPKKTLGVQANKKVVSYNKEANARHCVKFDPLNKNALLNYRRPAPCVPSKVSLHLLLILPCARHCVGIVVALSFPSLPPPRVKASLTARGSCIQSREGEGPYSRFECAVETP